MKLPERRSLIKWIGTLVSAYLLFLWIEVSDVSYVYRTDMGFFEYGEAGRHWVPHLEFGQARGVKYVYVILPLWIHFGIIALPTAMLWLCGGARKRENCCRFCGYDLTGNVSGTCPECGKGTASLPDNVAGER